MLAAFGAVAILLKTSGSFQWVVSPAVLVCTVSAMATMGLLVIMDQRSAGLPTPSGRWVHHRAQDGVRQRGLLLAHQVDDDICGRGQRNVALDDVLLHHPDVGFPGQSRLLRQLLRDVIEGQSQGAADGLRCGNHWCCFV
jgi:hypothetical protein